MTQLVVDRCVLFFQEFLITAQSCRAFTNWSDHFLLRIMTQWNSFLGIYAGMLDLKKKKSFLFYFIPFPSNNLRTSSRLKKKKRKKKIPTPHIIIPFFSLSDRVIQYGDDNRMTVQNVAIVFGPTLLRPETESSNITMYMVFQNQIVEFILNEYERIFYSS